MYLASSTVKDHRGGTKQKSKASTLKQRIEDGRPPPALHGGNHHRQQIHHDEVGKVKERIHQKAEGGGQNKI